MDVEQRLQKLEHENRLVKSLCLFALAVAVVIGLNTQGRPATAAPSAADFDEISAKKFRLVNDAGDLMAILAIAQEDGLPYLNLLDSRGDPMVTVQVVSDDRGGAGLIGMGLTGDGRSRLLMRAFDDDGDSFIQSRGGNNEVTWIIPK